METRAHTWLEKAKKSAGRLIVLGVLEIVAGFLAVGAPLLAGIAVTVLVGVALLMGGAVRLVSAFMADSFGAGAISFLWGLLVTATGFYLFVRPGGGLVTLTLVITLVLFVDGVTRILIAVHMRPVKGWGWMLTGGILSIIFAAMIGWEFPMSSLWVVGTLVGISLLFSGFTTITIGVAARRAVSTVAPGV
jgi:uncharacterized membrane protein HdeD (DUF308 family)